MQCMTLVPGELLIIAVVVDSFEALEKGEFKSSWFAQPGLFFQLLFQALKSIGRGLPLADSGTAPNPL